MSPIWSLQLKPFRNDGQQSENFHFQNGRKKMKMIEQKNQGYLKFEISPLLERQITFFKKAN